MITGWNRGSDVQRNGKVLGDPWFQPLFLDSLSRGGLQDDPRLFPVELLADRLGPSLNKALERMRRMIDPKRILSRGDRHRPRAHRLVELGQAKRRFGGHGAAKDGHQFIDAPAQSVRDEQAGEKIIEALPIHAPKLGHGHDAFKESVLPHPRLPDARAFELLVCADPEIAPRGVQIPGNES